MVAVTMSEAAEPRIHTAASFLPGSVMADPSALTVSGLLALPGAVIEDEQ